MSELELRLAALGVAMETEGPKATTDEVLNAAHDVYAWLTGAAAKDNEEHPAADRRG